MRRWLASVTVAGLALVAAAPAGSAGARPSFTPGGAGIGDPYFPLAGNGGYDVQHYHLEVAYDPATDVLDGRATIVAKATQRLSSFNLDLDGLTVRRVRVNGASARFSRDGGELTIVPRWGITKRSLFIVVVTYDGVPEPVNDVLGTSGFLHTDDGTLVAGQPRVASTWYPVNDHPLDTASYVISIKVPEGLEAISNGVLAGTRTRHGSTTWTWVARAPMASYLTTMMVGEFDVRSYRADGVRYWDAVDPDLYAPTAAPRTGEQMVLSQQGQPTYKRLLRTIGVPATGDQALRFWVDRDTEFSWDYLFVEAHTPGADDWTTLPELSGITSQDMGSSCPYWLSLHPFLGHYQTDNGDGTCSPTGATGAWYAATGSSGGYEEWTVDLSAYAGAEVELSLTYASDDSVQANGVTIDDIDVPGTAGDTGFEADGDVLDGWTVPGAPEGSLANENDWIVGTSADGPPPLGLQIDASFARQPEIIAFLAGYFGDYPFSTAGGIVDDYPNLGFALENQTRPIYSAVFFDNPINADAVVVHEITHQWFGDDLPLARWQDIWLNEGFATYAEWLWSEHEGLGTPDDLFGFYTSIIEPDNPFWSLTIGDPGPELLFDQAVYLRGAMTLHALRLEVGDDAFFEIIRTWAARKSGKNVSTPQFIRHAERIAGVELDDLFETWLFTPAKPDLPAPVATASRRTEGSHVEAPAIARSQMLRWGMVAR